VVEKIVKEILNESIRLKKKIVDDPSLLSQINNISSIIIEAYRRKK